jgi:hypothetical protein
VLNRMEADVVIGRYCIAGAFAAFYYIEPSVTEDLDILVSFEEMKAQSGLVTLQPVISYLNEKGYSEFQKEGILVEGWPVQFLPVAGELDAEALASAQDIVVRLEGSDVRTRLLGPEHIVASALRTGRPKDRVRVVQFLEAEVVEISVLCAVIERHGLTATLAEFCRSVGLADPCVLASRP